MYTRHTQIVQWARRWIEEQQRAGNVGPYRLLIPAEHSDALDEPYEPIPGETPYDHRDYRLRNRLLDLKNVEGIAL